MHEPLKWETALERLNGNEEALIDLADKFLTLYEEQLGKVKAAVEKRDPDALREAAHLVKGSLEVFDAGAATEVATRLEKRAENRQLEGVEQMVQTLVDRTEEVAAALREKVNEGEG
jgi:HPt (histidine-containing phosphotransfer) domain-containing protein